MQATQQHNWGQAYLLHTERLVIPTTARPALWQQGICMAGNLTAGIHHCLVKVPAAELAALHLLHKGPPSPWVQQPRGLGGMTKQLKDHLLQRSKASGAGQAADAGMAVVRCSTRCARRRHPAQLCAIATVRLTRLVGIGA